MNVCTALIRSYIQEHIIMNVRISVYSYTLMFYFRSSESIDVMFLFPDLKSLRKILCICFYSQHWFAWWQQNIYRHESIRIIEDRSATIIPELHWNENQCMLCAGKNHADVLDTQEGHRFISTFRDSLLCPLVGVLLYSRKVVPCAESKVADVVVAAGVVFKSCEAFLWNDLVVFNNGVGFSNYFRFSNSFHWFCC